MNRRNFLKTVCATTLGLFGFTVPKFLIAKPKMVSDYKYAMVLFPPVKWDGNIDYEKYSNCLIPYLNGKPVTGVQEANAEDGWIARYSFDNKLLEKVYGDVAIMNDTPEHRAAFEKICKEEKDILILKNKK